MDSVLIVQRAHLDGDAAFFECRIPGETLTLLIARRGGRLGLGLVPGKSRPQGATKRAWLENVRVLGQAGSGLVLQRHERQLLLQVEGGRGLRVGPHDEPLPIEPLDLDALRAAGPALLRDLSAQRFGNGKSAVLARLNRAIARLERRAERILGDLDKLAALERRASLAPLFMAEAAKAARGTRQLIATDWSSGEPVQVELALDPSKTARGQLEALFRRAKRAKAGRNIAERRWEEATDRAARLRQLAERVQGAADDDALALLVQEARSIAPKDIGEGMPTRARDPQARALCYREYTSARGEPILVGRGGEHNDALTFGVARPHDLWLHTKDWPGAHVIIPLAKNRSAPQELLLDAAELAAHFSEAAGEKIVAVQIVERRYLRKPRGAPKGFVVTLREKVLELRPEPARLERLLGGVLEDASP